VNITGPCFEPNMRIRCKFDTEEVIGTYVDTNRALCVQPYLNVEGYIRFEVSTRDGAFNWKGKYFVGKYPSRLNFTAINPEVFLLLRGGKDCFKPLSSMKGNYYSVSLAAVIGDKIQTSTLSVYYRRRRVTNCILINQRQFNTWEGTNFQWLVGQWLNFVSITDTCFRNPYLMNITHSLVA